MKRFLCFFGFHYWRTVFHRNARLDVEGGQVVMENRIHGEFYPACHRCKWCGKEEWP